MIEVRDLVKQYGDHIAVDHLSFQVEKGCIYGFLGPNGAGKSTTMNIITGCLAATDGQVLIDGFDAFERPMEAKKRIGYLPEQPPVYPDMTPLEYLRFVAKAKNIRKEDVEAQVASAMERTGITHMKNRLIRHLSKGYRQRVGFAQAILGDPAVIILDEPTVGLDPMQIIEIRDLIQSLGKEHTVILSSHILSEVSAVCDQVMIINKGKLVAIDTPERLGEHFLTKATIRLLLKGDETAARAALGALPEGVELTFSPSEEAGTVSVYLEMPHSLDVREQVFHACAGAGVPILSMESKVATLEDVFLQLTAEAEGAAEAAPPAPDQTPEPEPPALQEDKPDEKEAQQ